MTAAGRWQSSGACCQNEVSQRCLLAGRAPRVLGQEGQLPRPLALNRQGRARQGPA